MELSCDPNIKNAILSTMKVSEIGEFGLIDLLGEMIGDVSDDRLIIAIGDDAAAWHGDPSIQLATVDSLIQDTYFSFDTASWKEVGWKALAVNLSDIAAMGGIPRYALVSLSLPGDTEVDNVTALYQGMLDLARRFKVAIIGGNISNAPKVAIHVTVLGSAVNQDSHILTRSTARPGDKIAVTGHLGASAAGLEMLLKGLTFDPEAASAFRKAFLQPSPRIVEGQLLVKHGVKTAIDISDGLVADLGHVCRASKVGARLKVDRIPISPPVQTHFGDRALEMALTGGEEYQLLFTAAPAQIDNVKADTSCPVTVIGEITADNIGEIVLVDSNGSLVDLPATGWDHFTKK